MGHPAGLRAGTRVCHVFGSTLCLRSTGITLRTITEPPTTSFTSPAIVLAH